MRPARARIDLQALRHNYRLARRLGGDRALAVVKADAYGHGAVACAQALAADVDGFGVACIEEALQLREAGIAQPIVLLEGCFDADELTLVDRHGLWPVVATEAQLQALERHPPTRPLRVWLKLDSGMHRLGFDAAGFAEAWRRLHALPGVAGVVAMTHLARADELACAHTAEQIDAFDRVCSPLPVSETSIGNSAGLLAWPRARREWVRPGLMLYGASRFDGPCAEAEELHPVLTLESRIIAVRELGPGEPVGYGGTYVTDAPTRIGVVALGYADGYPQFAPTGTPVSIDGRPGRLVGRVSMDMLTVDLSDHPQAGPGSQVQLWGDRVRVAEVAARCGGSAYQLMTGLKRVAREYRD
ncbi:alanine racemase [Pseudoxanthomonas kalamensis DSM 18571]|uniref:alanine racemase n=1 Tax=Pseudoxanthomonas kalamensis TaxID=289483 RepID=UPI001391497E|nr:alanine racemase [Pseudoxanthomonas kalamensis]KAF1712203.1 alanine racemase [Pseudoxanthomonas kalamensis DSM 18571]